MHGHVTRIATTGIWRPSNKHAVFVAVTYTRIRTWEAAIGDELACEREPTHVKDRYAVAVVKDGVVVGPLPKNICHVCSLFIRRRCHVE